MESRLFPSGAGQSLITGNDNLKPRGLLLQLKNGMIGKIAQNKKRLAVM
jgi:hypothetical protein